MKCYLVVFLFAFAVLYGCQIKTYKPEGLTKLTESELINRAKKRQFPDVNNIVFKNEIGEVLSYDDINKKRESNEWIADNYIDENGVVKELVLRKASKTDLEFIEELKKAYSDQQPIELVDIDCGLTKEILEKIFKSDQEMRKNEGIIEPQIDQQNLTMVISLIEKCGMPTLNEVEDKHLKAVWLVFQHCDNYYRKKYFPLLEQSAKNGDISEAQLAMLKDRTLMMDGEPQMYGTQVKKNDGKWVLYDLNKPERVNKRRLEVGLGPIQEYLYRWNIEFDVKQSD